MDKRHPRRVFFNYTEDNLKSAIEAVRNGMLKKEASRAFEIPRSTLIRKLSGESQEKRKMGPDPVLGVELESRIKKWMLDLAKQGFPLTWHMVFMTVKKFLDDKEKELPNRPSKQLFKDNIPGEKWWQLFLSRHTEVKEKTAEALTRSRAEVTEAGIRSWFNELAVYLKEEGYFHILEDPTRIFNADETGFLLCPKNGKVIGLKGKNDFYCVEQNNSKEQLTVMAAFSAAGWIVPPMVLYPYVRIPCAIARNHPPAWGIGATSSGWRTGEIFFEYIGNHFVPSLKKEGVTFPILLFIDGHRSHLTLHTSELCRSLEVILVSLHPNSTHILQPADVSVFKPLKTGWSKVVKVWKYEHFPQEVTRHTFAQLLSTVFQNTTKESIINGFRTCGLYPFDANAVDYTKCIEVRCRGDNEEKQLEKELSGVLFLRELEKNIDDELLSTFNECFPNDWQGKEEALLLYNLWRSKKREQQPNDGASEGEGFSEVNEHRAASASSNSDCSAEASDQTAMSEPEVLEKFKDYKTPSPFKKCFFYPKREEKIVRRKLSLSLPSVVTSDSFVSYLEKKEREKVEKEREKLRREQDREDKKAGKAKVKKRKIIEESDENANFSVHDESDASELTISEDEDEVASSQPFDGVVEKGNFIVAEFVYNEKTKRETRKVFIGEVVEVSGGLVTAKFLRKSTKVDNVYIFPDVEDVQCVNISQILKTVQPYQIVRGRHYFRGPECQ
ncbi:uncharacterized protein [Anabrus simplex]|uniref:uncharacterized protein n=1 Tax=Anabrus simplex TaxID=316456 RepID=UPI0035A27258